MANPRLFGRELDLPETAVTVRMRDGRTVLDEGPGADADAALSRINVIECADLDTALAAVGDGAETAAGIPYLLLTWIDDPGWIPGHELIAAMDAWRRDLDARGHYVMGSSLGGVEAAAIQRLRDPHTIAADTPFNEVDGQTIAVEVILAADRRQALALAAGHPLARDRTIQVRPFLSTHT